VLQKEGCHGVGVGFASGSDASVALEGFEGKPEHHRHGYAGCRDEIAKIRQPLLQALGAVGGIEIA
jgi:hypothetical protein